MATVLSARPPLNFLFRACVALCLMLGKSLVEVVDIDFESALLSKLDGHFHGEAVGVVEAERGFTADGVAHEVMAKLFKLAHAALKRLFKARFFHGDFVYYAVVVFDKLGIDVGILADDGFGNLDKLTCLDVEVFGKADSSSEQSSQYIALVDVGASDALFVAYHEHGRADVVCDYADSLGSLVALAVLFAADFFDSSDNGREQVGFVHGLFALKYAQRAL